MEKLLHSQLSELFLRSFQPLRLRSRFLPEQKTEKDGVTQRADIYDWSLTGSLFTLSLKRKRTYGSFLSRGGETTLCTLNGKTVASFFTSDVEKLLKETGWKIAVGIESEENSDRTIERTEDGKREWRRNLPYFRAEGLSMVLDYFPENEGSYVLALEIRSDLPIDSDRKMRLNLGFRDWRAGKEPSDGFRKALADVLRYWLPYVDALGFESPDVIDYYTILSEIVGHPENGRQHFVLDKNFNRKAHGNSMSIGPDDFSWWREGFTDTPEQRNTFMKWYDSFIRRDDERRAEALREFGLDESAGEEEIRSAYRKKIRAFHPDIIGSKGLDPAFLSFAEKETERLTALYEYLLDTLR